jgi:hypothetical protein
MDRGEDLDRLAEDWIALWQSELSALAADPELAEAWAAWAALAAAWMRAAAAPRMHFPFPWPGADAVAPAWSAPPPWPASAAGAPEPGGDAGDAGGMDATALRARVAELERRLADLERRTGGSGADRGRPRSPRRRT